MPFCSHCGKEVTEDTKFCPECGQRLKEGFTPEERQKYIEELKASVEEEKPAKKTKMTKRKLTGIIIASIIVVFVAIALAFSGEPAERKPENIIPLRVSGFEFVEKSERVKGLFEGEEYSAYSFFEPSIGSKFDGKVEDLVIDVRKFKDETSAGDVFSMLAGVGTAEEIQVDNVKATLVYREDLGETYVLWQRDKLVIMSGTMGPFDITTFEVTVPDEQVLKDAAIEGARATARNL